MIIQFTKMEGAGNDYIYVDASRFPVEDPAALSRRLSDRHFGIGADGLVLICPSEVADFRMRMYNADGSEGLMCGNAARCIGKFVHDKGLLDGRSELTLETLSGIKTIKLHTGADGCVDRASVGMGSFRASEPLAINLNGRSVEGISVDVGNPHFIIFVPDASGVNPALLGPAIERHPSFPDRTNVEFVSLEAPASAGSPGRLRMRVWERGSGITLACGTGACASAAAASLRFGGTCYEVACDGGTLRVDVSGSELVLSGPARTVFEGTIQI